MKIGLLPYEEKSVRITEKQGLVKNDTAYSRHRGISAGEIAQEA